MTGPTVRQAVAIAALIRSAEDRLAHGPKDRELRMEAADDYRRAARIYAEASMPKQAAKLRALADLTHAPDPLSRAIAAPCARMEDSLAE